jgi:hypothetical protein
VRPRPGPYPRSPRAMPIVACRLQRRDVDGDIRRSRANGRRLEGERDGSRSRRPAATVSGGASAMAPSRLPPRGTGPRIGMGSDPQGLTPAGGRSLQRDANRRRRGCREATRGAGNRPLYRLPSRHPRTRRTLAGVAVRGRWRLQECGFTAIRKRSNVILATATATVRPQRLLRPVKREGKTYDEHDAAYRPPRPVLRHP